MRTSETGEVIKPEDPDNGFNKTAFTGRTQDYHIPIATYSPEQIFAGNVQGLDINFIDPNFDGEYVKGNTLLGDDVDADGNKLDKDGKPIPLSSAGQLQPTIATWYVALRNLTVVGLLSVLVYVGIRIIISSTASDKAKYKQMLIDWLVALCLVFFLHYIMSFTLTLTESICNAISGNGEETVVLTIETENGEQQSFKTNLLGAARFKTQYNDFGQKVAYMIMYLALIFYTCAFTFFYLKRLLMMAFLTLIAPVVALTYPIDKISDGKSQAFNSWLKEYVFNALIQPFHLIIYTVFVGSAMDLASTNIIYMIAALWFIFQAEKILRKFFGFENAGAGTLGALAGGAALATVAKKGMSMLGGGKGGSKQKTDGSNGEENKPPRFENKHNIADIEGPGNVEGPEAPETSGGASATDANIGNENEDPVTRMEREALAEKIADGQINKDELTEQQKQLLGIANNNQQQSTTPEQQNNNQNNNAKNNKFMNWARGHNINKRTVGKAIKGVAKFGTKTAFKAGAGTLSAAVALASGGGIGAAGAAFMAGSAVGGRLGNAAVGLGSAAWHGASRTARAGTQLLQGETEEAANTLLGGTRLGREIDLAHGNTRFQDIGESKEVKTDENNLRYLGDMMAKENGGIRPSAKEVKERMDSFDPYIAEGLKDIKQMLGAQKSEIYTGSAKQSALIAAIGKERKITADVLNNKDQTEAKQANLRQDFINKGYSQAAATRQADFTINVLKAQNGVAHNLKKVEQKTNSQSKTKK